MLLLQICQRCNTFCISQVQQARLTSTLTLPVSRSNDGVLKKMGYVKSDYKKILPKKRTIRELNLEKVVNKLFELGFTYEDIRKQPKIMWLHPFLIDHRFNLLEESGVNRKSITLERIRRFPRLNTTAIQDLKNKFFISKDTDVVHNILSFSNLPRELYPKKTSDGELFGDAQTKALQIYISWKLGLTLEEVKTKYHSYEGLHQKSIRLVIRSYETLVNRLEMPEHKIKQNVFLLEGHPDNFLEILERLPRVGGTSIQYIASTNPKIMMRPVKKMLKVIRILKKYNVPDEGFVWYSNVLTLSPDTVQERAAALFSDPVINPFFCSPRIAYLIARYHTSNSRMRLLTTIKWKCLSIALLTNIEEHFQKRIDLGRDENRSTDVLYYLNRHLGYEKKELKNQIALHPHYYLLPLSAITETLQFLLANNIAKSDIFKALPIVLYPKEKVARWLAQVHTQPEVQHLRDKEDKLHPSLVLQLVLYYMERPHHFNGNGVFSEQDVRIDPRLH